MTDTCDIKFIEGKLNLPRLGLCKEEEYILWISIIASFLIQAFRHKLYDLISVRKWELLDLDIQQRPFHKILNIMFLQLAQTILWILNILIIVKSNVWVILSHTIADFIFSGYYIWKTPKIHKQHKEIKQTKIIF